MHTRLTSALACATLLAAMAAQTVHAGTERPRDGGVGCARTDNRYCKVAHELGDGAARAASQGSESFRRHALVPGPAAADGMRRRLASAAGILAGAEQAGEAGGAVFSNEAQ